jgi:TonB family protein
MSATGSLLLDVTVRISLILLAALAAVALMRRRSAAMRHWVLATAVVSAAAAPLLGLVAPSWPMPLSAVPPIAVTAPPGSARTSVDATASRATAANGVSIGNPRLTALRLVGLVWLPGAGFGLLVLVAGLGRLAWISARSRPIVQGRWHELSTEISCRLGLERTVRLLQSDHATLLVTWGIARPAIILPASAAEWPEDRARIVLAHELAHVQRRDWAVVVGAQLLRSVYWFNPLVWIVCRRLRHESEQATDDAVLRSGVEGTDYASQLVELARAFRGRRRVWLPAPAIVRPSSLERRIGAMLNTRVNRSPLTPSARFVIIVGIFAVAAAIASAQGAFATFSGSVFDPLNGTVPGVRLILTNAENQSKYEVRSDQSGRFEFVGLPRGDYSLEAILPGFATLRGAVTVTGQNLQQDVTLKIGVLEEAINVVGRRGSDEPARAPARLADQERPRPAPAACTPSATGGNIRPPRKLKDVKPRYPAALVESGTGGTVVLDARLGRDGTVEDVRVTTPAHPDLDASAVDAVRQWGFTETLLNCVPVEVSMNVVVNYRVE